MSICLICNKSIVDPRRGDVRKYCSAACMGRAYQKIKPEKSCSYCGKSFRQKHSLVTRVSEYCSKTCAASKWSRPLLLSRIEQLILERNQYTPGCVIREALSISSKTMVKFKISVLKVNNDLGFFAPASLFENKVYKILLLRFEDVIRQKSFDDCLSPNGNKLRCDFYIPEINTILECDGPTHYDPSYPGYEVTSTHDAIKNSYCKQNRIDMIRFLYQRKVNKADVISLFPDTVWS